MLFVTPSRLLSQAFLIALLCHAVSCGCDSSAGRVGVSGRVTFVNEQPVDRGTIEFSRGGGGAGGGSPIIDGNYSIAREKGLAAGSYVVRIYSPTLVKAEPGAPGPLGLAPPRERVHKTFNVESKLKQEIAGTSDLTINFQVEPSSTPE